MVEEHPEGDPSVEAARRWLWEAFDADPDIMNHEGGEADRAIDAFEAAIRASVLKEIAAADGGVQEPR